MEGRRQVTSGLHGVSQGSVEVQLGSGHCLRPILRRQLHCLRKGNAGVVES